MPSVKTRKVITMHGSGVMELALFRLQATNNLAELAVRGVLKRPMPRKLKAYVEMRRWDTSTSTFPPSLNLRHLPRGTTNMKTLNLTLAHADTCLSSYWSGHHLPHIGVPISSGTTLDQLKDMLKAELNEYVCGNGLLTTLMNRQPIHTYELDELAEMMTDYGTTLEGLYDMVEEAAKRAIAGLTSKSETPFKDLVDDPDDPEDLDDYESVQAYFVFILEE